MWWSCYGDYGWGYEAASRLATGEHFGTDFVIGVAPLAFALQSLFIRALGNHLIVNNLFLYVCWLLSLAAGGRLAWSLNRSAPVVASGVVVAAALSNPAYSLGHSYGYLSTATAGLTIILLLRAIRQATVLAFASVGVGLGLTLLSKQNIGIFLLPVTLAAIVVISWTADLGRRLLSALTAALCALVILGSGIVAITAGERSLTVLRFLFVDIGAVKGGPLMILGRAFPRLSFPIDAAGGHFRGLEIALTAPLLMGLAFLFWTMFRPKDQESANSSVAPALYLAGGLTALSLLTLLVSQGDAVGGVSYQILYSVTTQLPYMALVIGLGVFLLRRLRVLVAGRLDSRETNAVLAAALLAALIIAQNASASTYFVYSAPVAMTAFIALVARAGALAIGWIAGGAALPAIVLLCASPDTVRRVALPPESPFAGLYATPDQARQVWFNWTRIRPLIAGKRTLWLAGGGPHSAYGGRAVPNVSSLFHDTHTPEYEDFFVDAWRRNPPERVVWNEPTFFKPERVQLWLAANYAPLLRDGKITVWALKSGCSAQ
jgi:hypothetical protein